jgi:hypothetical protein
MAIDPENPNSMRTEFLSRDGETKYVYDFDELDIQPMLLAQSVFTFGQAQGAKPPRDLKELELGGRMDILAVGMSYLLRREMPNGELEEFERLKTQHPAYRFICKLKAPELERLELCKANFFTRRKLQDVESMRPLMNMLLESPQLMERVLEKLQSGIDEKPKNGSVPQSSTIPENSAEESGTS